jgi:hypothetical protein
MIRSGVCRAQEAASKRGACQHRKPRSACCWPWSPSRSLWGERLVASRSSVATRQQRCGATRRARGARAGAVAPSRWAPGCVGGVGLPGRPRVASCGSMRPVACVRRGTCRGGGKGARAGGAGAEKPGARGPGGEAQLPGRGDPSRSRRCPGGPAVSPALAGGLGKDGTAAECLAPPGHTPEGSEHRTPSGVFPRALLLGGEAPASQNGSKIRRGLRKGGSTAIRHPGTAGSASATSPRR